MLFLLGFFGEMIEITLTNHKFFATDQFQH
jgi:hypothetical protein